MRNVQGTYQLDSQNLTPPSFYTETLESVHTHVHTRTHTHTHTHTHFTQHTGHASSTIIRLQTFIKAATLAGETFTIIVGMRFFYNIAIP